MRLSLVNQTVVQSNASVMRKLTFWAAGMIAVSLSCSESVTESIDCQHELAATFISDSVSLSNPKQWTFTLNYPGSYTVTVRWEYGDGTTETKAGLTTTHVYDTSGYLKVQAEITLSGIDIGSCSVEKEKNITVP